MRKLLIGSAACAMLALSACSDKGADADGDGQMELYFRLYHDGTVAAIRARLSDLDNPTIQRKPVQIAIMALPRAAMDSDDARRILGIGRQIEIASQGCLAAPDKFDILDDFNIRTTHPLASHSGFALSSIFAKQSREDKTSLVRLRRDSLARALDNVG